ncbi:MAG: DNA recombination protein RmuC [Planctomycetota bacterium]|nr:DNA recombination protein RmuC [Planctomycetota bacterium]
MDYAIVAVVALILGLIVSAMISRGRGAVVSGESQQIQSQLDQSRAETVEVRGQAQQSSDSLIRSDALLESAQEELRQIKIRFDDASNVASAARESLVAAQSERSAAVDQLKQLKEDREVIKESIQAFSATQMKENREQFLEQAEERLGQSEQKHASELTKRHEAIEVQFKGVQEKLATFQEMNRKIEEQRIKAFGSLNQQVLDLSVQTKAVETASLSLSAALKGSSQSRGKWGEMALKNIVEVAGMTEHCDFEEQDQNAGERRPDMVVRLPGDGRIPIDAKVPWADFDRAQEATDPAECQAHLVALGKTVRRTMKELSERDYPRLVGGKVDYTVMFIAIESVAAAAFSVEPNLQQEAIEKKILIATPVTLIALLKTVGLYWQQEKLAANAQEIWDETSELHERLNVFHGHLAKVGKNLNTAVIGYNSAVGSFEGRVLPKARIIEKLSNKEGLKELPRVETDVRDAATAAIDYIPEQVSTRLGEMDPTDVDQIANNEESR